LRPVNQFLVENSLFAVPVEMEGSGTGLLTTPGLPLTLQWKQRGRFQMVSVGHVPILLTAVDDQQFITRRRPLLSCANLLS
jgi:hypothetical protein